MTVALAAAAAVTKNPEQLPFTLTIAAASSLLPDIDTPDSILRYKLRKYTGMLTLPALVTAGYFLFYYGYFSLPTLALYLIYMILAFAGPHRGFTHSLLGFITFVLVLFFSNKTIILPAVIGYSTHLFVDMLTPAGIPLFYPYNKDFSVPLVHTGSMLDQLIGLASGIVFVIILSQKFI